MKKFKTSFRKLAGMVGIVLLTAGVLSACKKDDDTPPVDNRPYTISGGANGTQVVPGVTGDGTATITGTYNPETRKLNYTSNWTNLSGSPLSAGFYVGASGASGVAVGEPWTVNSVATGTVTGETTLTTAEANQLLAGNLYYTYSTSANPSGEIRGQITTSR